MHSLQRSLLLLLPLLAGCDGTAHEADHTGHTGPTARVETPEVVDLATLNDRLVPQGQEKALLVNFWATW